MRHPSKIVLAAVLAAMSLASPAFAGKPLKVFILSGQSNMVGMGSVATFPAIGMDPKTAPMLADLQDKEGKPVVCENVYIASALGGDENAEKFGKLQVGYGGAKGVNIGPEFAFGIYAHKLLDEPVLIIKAARGGRDLIRQFRPPSAGPFPLRDEDIARLKEQGKDVEAAKKGREESIGVEYRWMMEYVKRILADPKRVYPDYDPEAGYELAGFAWLQGYNDFIGGYYPFADPAAGKNNLKDYSEYTRLLGCFIRDIRTELNAPKLPFVIGVFGMDGKQAEGNIVAFRKAQAASAEMPEFKGNVVNVMLEDYWPEEISALKAKETAALDGSLKLEGEAAEALKELQALKKAAKGKKQADDAKKPSRAEVRAQNAHQKELLDTVRKACMTPQEVELINVGVSNQGYHYWGSAKFYSQAGKAFAEALVKPKP